MKYSQWIGIAAAVVLVVACYMPWTYHPDLQKNFTGFFSENRIYGMPGKVFIVLAIITSIFFLIPRVWAKRTNLLICALTVAYAIKSFILYSGCYRGICPEKKIGLWIVLASSALMLVMALLPDTKVPEKKRQS
jgi:hypothetical protein